MDNKKINRGQIRAIRGSVVDAFFPQLLPKINYQLKSHEAIIESIIIGTAIFFVIVYAKT